MLSLKRPTPLRPLYMVEFTLIMLVLYMKVVIGAIRCRIWHRKTKKGACCRKPHYLVSFHALAHRDQVPENPRSKQVYRICFFGQPPYSRSTPQLQTNGGPADCRLYYQRASRVPETARGRRCPFYYFFCCIFREIKRSAPSRTLAQGLIRTAFFS